jgi:diguanylate cyclase (GGDEF)-like protein
MQDKPVQDELHIGADLRLKMANSLLAEIDVSQVLGKTIEWMKARFSTDRCDLLLSQDQSYPHEAVKPLYIRNPQNDLCCRAFIEGRMAVAGEPDVTEAAAPLKGKQGIYGVIHLRFPDAEHRRTAAEDLAYLRILAEYAGTAFEIARLYEQSNKLVKELKIINELTKNLNKSLHLSDILSFANRDLLDVFSADYCCLLLVDSFRQHLVVKACNAPELIDRSFNIQYGFAGMMLRTREPVIISDYDPEQHVDSELMVMTKGRSLIGAPIMAGSEPIGAILLVHRQPSYFSFDQFKLLQMLAGNIGLSVSNAYLHAEIRKMVITDQLTGLYVRHYLYEQIELMQKRDACGALIVMDVDDFKKLNDRYGHQVGDRVLIQICDIVRRNIRSTDIAARWGGEELAVYLPLLDKEQARAVAERIRMTVEAESDPTATVSCGIADWHQKDGRTSVDSLFHRADMALYEAKRAGKNTVCTA